MWEDAFHGSWKLFCMAVFRSCHFNILFCLKEKHDVVNMYSICLNSKSGKCKIALQILQMFWQYTCKYTYLLTRCNKYQTTCTKILTPRHHYLYNLLAYISIHFTITTITIIYHLHNNHCIRIQKTMCHIACLIHWRCLSSGLLHHVVW
jgi:hypothetical protein